MNRLSILFLVFAVVLMARAAHAVDAIVTPASSSAGVDASAFVNLTSPGALAGLDERTPLLDVLASRSVPLTALVSPSSFGLVWNPVFEGIASNYTSVSSQGVFQLDGEQVGIRNQALSAFCISPTCPTVAETLTLPPALRERIARALLAGVTLRDAAQGRIGTPTATLRYTRAWTHTGTGPDHRATFTVLLSLSPNFDVRLSQFELVEVTGSTTAPVLPVGTPASIPVTLNWNARFQVLGTPPPATLRSTAVEILTPDGALIQRIPRAITKQIVRARTLAESFPTSGVASGTERFTDALMLPASVSAAARAAGASRVILRRRFSDGSNTVDGEIVVPLGSASMAGFQITRVDLRFDDGARARVVDRDSALNAVADINYLGSGQLRALWEWAPVSDGGNPFFRPLPPSASTPADAGLLSDFQTRQSSTLVREFLNNQQRIKLVSPPLPTSETGGVLLRLRISAPQVVFDLPVVRYFVGSSAAPPVAGAAELAPLRLLQPRGEDDLTVDTLFRWLPVSGARAYRLECYADLLMTGDMVSGAVVPGRRTQLSPSLLVMDHVVDGAGYWCRMVAIGEDGLLNAASDLVRLTARR